MKQFEGSWQVLPPLFDFKLVFFLSKTFIAEVWGKDPCCFLMLRGDDRRREGKSTETDKKGSRQGECRGEE